MNRILGLFAAAGVLLSACGGGGIQSPDFTPVLQGINITYSGKTASSVATVTPGGSLQFSAVGLYSTPPGTAASNNTVACQTASNGIGVCTLGQISGVSWSVDPVSGNTGAVATIDNTGKATGTRRGNATIRAKAGGFETTDRLLVSGAVLESVQITPTPSDSVPTGRSITLKATPRCADQGTTSNANCVPGKVYNYTWSLPSTFPADTVEFTSGSTGESIVVKTKRFGQFNIDVAVTNEEGTRVNSTIPLTATVRVLDDVIVSADPVVAPPVPLIKGTQTRFVARGRFSDGTIGDIQSTDLGGPGNKLTWTRDTSSLGQFTIPDQASAPAPNTAVIATVASNAQLGSSGLTASGVNTESPTLSVDDRIAVDVRDVGLIAVTRICLNADLGSACTTDIQLPLNETYVFKARGTFQGDAAGVERDIDPKLLPVTWGKTTDSTNITVTTTTGDDPGKGSVRGDVQGAATINVALNAGVAPTVSDRDQALGITVVDQDCRDQLLTSNGTEATSQDSLPNAGGNVQDAGNVIDANPATFGRFNVVVGGGSEETLSMIFRRNGTVVTPPAVNGQNEGQLTVYNPQAILPEVFTLRTVNATGATVQSFSNLQPATVTRGSQTFRYITANATQPFSGLRLEATLPAFSLLDVLSDPTNLPAIIQALMNLGGSSETIDVYTACANVNRAAQ